MVYDLAIVGGGPAGAAAGVYAGRKKLKTIFLTLEIGGQSTVSPAIENWIGVKSISGEELAKRLKEHIYVYQNPPDFEIKEFVKVVKITKEGENFKLTDDAGNNYQSKTALVVTGASRRKLAVPGAKEFEQHGLTYCATCDGPLFAGKNVAVIGGGNAGFESAIQLLAYAQTVTLLHHNEKPKADQIIIERAKQHPQFKLLLNAETTQISGDQMVKSLTYKNVATGVHQTLNVEGVFVEIGIIPNTDLVKDLVRLNQYGMIIVDSRNQRSSLAGLWAAGDCSDGLFHQNNIAAGDAVKALEDIYNYLQVGK